MNARSLITVCHRGDANAVARHAIGFAVALWLMQPSSVCAGNDDELLAGNEAAMMGGAVAAFVHDGSAAWYNPAGLGAIARDQIDVSGSVYTLRFYSAPAFIRNREGASDDASVTEFVSIPTQIAYARQLAPGMTLALGYFVPQATNLVLREQLVATVNSRRETWQVAYATSRTLHNAAAALGLALTQHVRVGFGLIASYQSEAESSVVFQSVAEQGTTERLTEVTAIGTSNRIGLELALGMQAELSSRWSLGISARTPRLQVARSSDYLFTRGLATSPNDDDDALLTGEAARAAPEGDHTLALLRAGRIALSVAYRYAERSRICLEADAQPGLNDDGSPQRRKAVINARLGLFHQLSARIGLGVGLFSDRSPDVLGGRPGSGTGDYYGGTLGLEFSDDHLLSGHERASSLTFRSVFALRYAYTHGDMDDFAVDADKLGETAFGGVRGSLIAHELGLYVGTGLEF